MINLGKGWLLGSRYSSGVGAGGWLSGRDRVVVLEQGEAGSNTAKLNFL